MSLLLLKDKINDPEHCQEVINVIKNEVSGVKPGCTVLDIVDAVSAIKIRDGLLRSLFEEKETLDNFINWWGTNNAVLQNHLTDEQKAHMLALMSGVLLMNNMADIAEEAATNCMEYSQKANMSTPGLALLIKSCINKTKQFGKPEDAHIIWKDSLSNITMEEILNT